MRRENKTRKILICSMTFAVAVLLVISASAPQAAGSIVNINELALWAGDDLGLGKNVVINAPIAAGGNVSTGASVNIHDVYAEGRIWLAKNAVVRGNVLANKKAEAAGKLDLQGNWTGKSAYFGTKARIVGNVTARAKNIAISKYAQITGNVQGNRNIRIDRNSTINGDARPGISYNLRTGRNVTITGSTESGSVIADMFELPSIGDEPDGGTVGAENIWGAKNSTTTLLPGGYRNLGFGRNASLNLSAGTYTLKNFWMDKTGVVNIDATAGDVTLNVYGKFSTGNNVTFHKSDVGSLTINVFDHNMWLGNDASMTAAVRVFGGDFGTNKNAILVGTFYATDDIWLGSGSNVVVPEPATFALLSMGALVLIRRRLATASGT